MEGIGRRVSGRPELADELPLLLSPVQNPSASLGSLLSRSLPSTGWADNRRMEGHRDRPGGIDHGFCYVSGLLAGGLPGRYGFSVVASVSWSALSPLLSPPRPSRLVLEWPFQWAFAGGAVDPPGCAAHAKLWLSGRVWRQAAALSSPSSLLSQSPSCPVSLSRLPPESAWAAEVLRCKWGLHHHPVTHPEPILYQRS